MYLMPSMRLAVLRTCVSMQARTKRTKWTALYQMVSSQSLSWEVTRNIQKHKDGGRERKKEKKTYREIAENATSALVMPRYSGLARNE